MYAEFEPDASSIAKDERKKWCLKAVSVLKERGPLTPQELGRATGVADCAATRFAHKYFKSYFQCDIIGTRRQKSKCVLIGLHPHLATVTKH